LELSDNAVIAVFRQCIGRGIGYAAENGQQKQASK
jgi:hypothetical protein